jgi:hypothetical protein
MVDPAPVDKFGLTPVDPTPALPMRAGHPTHELDPVRYQWMRAHMGGNPRPVAFSGSGPAGDYVWGIALIDPAKVPDNVVAYWASTYRLTCDFEAYGVDDYGPTPPYCDAMINSVVDLQIYLPQVGP